MKTKLMYLAVFVTFLLSACSGGAAAVTQTSDTSAAQSTEPAAVAVTEAAQGHTSPTGNGQGIGEGTPPAEAIAACTGKAENDVCSFTDQNGDHTGTCKSGSGQLACAPDRGVENGGQGGQGGGNSNPQSGMGNQQGGANQTDVRQTLFFVLGDIH